jgi:hypothetical protein
VDIVSTANAPRVAYIGARVFWIRALTFEDRAIILGWLDDIIPGRHERKMPPRVSSEEAQAALASLNGKMLLVWLGLRHQGISFGEAAELAGEMTDVEYARWMDILYANRRTRPEVVIPDGSDIADTWCSKGMALMAIAIGMDGMLSLSLDQFEWLQREGVMDDEDPAYSPEKLAEAQAEMQARFGPQLAELALKLAQAETNG